MAVTYLVDNSATQRIREHPQIADRLENLLERGLMASCALLNLEAMYSARTPAEARRIFELRTGSLDYRDTDEQDMARAQEVYLLLADTGHARSVGFTDLVVAAVAERHGLAVLHYDGDYDLVAQITRQPTEWILPKGSI